MIAGRKIELLMSKRRPIMTDMAAWYRKGLGITDVANVVSAWADQSGNGRDLVQADVNKKPTKQADGTISGDGVSHMLKTAPFTLNQPVTVYVRFKPLSTPLGNRNLFDGNTGDQMEVLFQSNLTPKTYAGGAGLIASSVDVPLAWTTIAAVFSGSASVLQVDSTVSATVGNPGSGALGGFTLLGYGDGANNAMHAQVAEVIIYSAAHDAAQRAKTIAYLRTL